MTRITHAQARTIVEAAFSRGRELDVKPLSVIVLDAGAHPIAFERADGTPIGRFHIALAKAAGALSLGMSSRKIGELAAAHPTFISAVAPLLPGGLLPAAGGVLVLDGDGEVLGAVGVTGDTAQNDETCACAGVAAAGLIAAD